MEIDKNAAVCFTGHRNIPENEYEVLTEMVRKTILIYIRRGFKFFITGGAIGFDAIAAECINALKGEGYDICHVLALPCRDQTSKWNHIEDISFYKKILGSADHVVYAEDMYTKGCMHKRNRFMVDNSSVCIAYKTREKGGTAYTCKYAERNGVEFVNLGTIATQLAFC